MKRINSVCKLVVLPITIILLVLSGTWLNVRAQQNGQVTLNVEAGYGGYFRPNKWVPLLISVNNTGQDISGELRVTASGTSGLTADTFKTPVELATNSSKAVFLYVTLGFSAQQVRIDLATASGVITDVTRPLKALGPSDLLYAVITESPRGTIDLSKVESGIGDADQINWRVDSVPRNAEGLTALDVMVLADVDSGNLTTDQRQAIASWVNSGGHLIVTGGPNWQKTQAGVTDLLPLKPTKTTTLASLPSIAAYAGFPTQTLAAPAGTPIIVAQGDLTPDAQVLVSENGTPLLVRRTHGNGFVDYLAVDPGIEPFQSWQDRNRFWFTALTTTGVEPNWSNGVVNPEQATFAANLIKGLRLPDVFQLCGFLAIYIIFIGPLNYLILKRLGRRELAWLTIPLIILSCSVVAYLTGFSLRGSQATINRLAMVQVWPGTDQAQVDGIVGVLAPRRGVYDLATTNGLTLNAQPNDPASIAVTPNNYVIQEDTGYSVRRFPVDAGLTAVFSTTGYVKATPVESSATITLGKSMVSSGLASPAPRVSGTVKNTTGLTLSNAIVLGLGGRQELGTLEPGETRSFDFPLLPTPGIASPVSLGSALKSGSYLGGAFATGYSSYNSSTYSANRTVQDIMGRGFTNLYSRYPLGYGDTPEQQETRRRQAILEAMITSYDPSGGRGTNIYLAAWSDTSPIGIDLQGASFNTEDTTLYMFRLSTKIAGGGAEVEVPSSLFTWTPTDSSSRRDATPYGLNVQPGERIIFRYNPMPGIRLAKVTGLKIDLHGSSASAGTISLWDWTAAKWIDIKANSTSNMVIDAARYLGPENAIEMAVEAGTGTPLAAYDAINLALYGQLAEGIQS